MKRFFVFMAALVFTLCACQPTGDDITLELVDETPDSLVYTCERQTVKIKMICNRSWKASCSEEWIEIETGKGSAEEDKQYFKFTLSANVQYTYRTGEIVIKAGDKDLVLTVTQEPEINILINENFGGSEEDESALPAKWSSIDADNDGYGWRCMRDTETLETFAYSTSYYYFSGDLSPDNYMVSPFFRIPTPGYSVKWDAKGISSEYLGDKYEAWVAAYVSGQPLVYLKKLCEEVTTSATEWTHHSYSLDDEYVDLTLCIVFRHFDSVGLSCVLITNVEVSNRR